jgi:hypothetical protein
MHTLQQHQCCKQVSFLPGAPDSNAALLHKQEARLTRTFLQVARTNCPRVLCHARPLRAAQSQRAAANVPGVRQHQRQPLQLPDEPAPAPAPQLVWCLSKLSKHGIHISRHFTANTASDGAAASKSMKVAFAVHDADWPVEEYITRRPSAAGAVWQAVSADAHHLGPFGAILSTKLRSGNWKPSRLAEIRHDGNMEPYLDNGYCVVLQEWVRLCHGNTAARSLVCLWCVCKYVLNSRVTVPGSGRCAAANVAQAFVHGLHEVRYILCRHSASERSCTLPARPTAIQAAGLHESMTPPGACQEARLAQPTLVDG